MECHERERMIFEFLYNPTDGFLRRYTRPDQLSDDRAREEINDMATDMNGEIPGQMSAGEITAILGKVRSAVRKSHGSRFWPTIKRLCGATKDAAFDVATANTEAKPTSREWAPDASVINARRIEGGMPVGDGWIYGSGAVDMLRRELIAEDMLTGYRSSLFFEMKKYLGIDIAKRIEAGMMKRHAEASETGGDEPAAGDFDTPVRKFP